MKRFCSFGLILTLLAVLISCSSVPQKKVPAEYRSVIINADDLCQDRRTTDAILKCYKEGIVTS